MPAHYSIVQYVPDALRGECVNIGVVSFAPDAFRAVFLQNWQRVKAFTARDISFLKDLAREARHWDAQTVTRLSESWTGSIKVTPPQPSMLDAHDLLTDAAARYLVDVAADQRGYRIRADVVRILKTSVRDKLAERYGAYGRALLRDDNYPLRGQHMAYDFDVSVGNGHPLFVAQGLSFEMPTSKKLESAINATAWLVEDVKRTYQNLPIGVVVLAPRHQSDVYAEAVQTFNQLHAEVITEQQLPAWTDRMVDLVPAPANR